MNQTLAVTSLGPLGAGDPVNLELALRAADRLGGHVVQGHVDGTGTVAAVAEDGIAQRIEVELPAELRRYVVERGSIAVDGVSLTVAALTDRGFEVSLIPETLERTNLGSAEPGRVVNIEVDVVARYVERLVYRKEGTQRMAERTETAKTATESASSTIEEALEDDPARQMVVVCDGEDRENEGDLVLAAQFATPEAINFMAKEARGLICLAMTPERCEELGLKLMAAKNEAPLQTAFTVTIEAAEGVTTGISAHDRARTVQVAIDPHSTPGRPAPARPRLPAQGEGGRRPRAHRPHRGFGRPRAPRRPDPGRGDLRGHERGRDHGPRPRPRSPTASGTG